MIVCTSKVLQIDQRQELRQKLRQFRGFHVNPCPLKAAQRGVEMSPRTRALGPRRREGRRRR